MAKRLADHGGPKILPSPDGGGVPHEILVEVSRLMAVTSWIDNEMCVASLSAAGASDMEAQLRWLDSVGVTQRRDLASSYLRRASEATGDAIEEVSGLLDRTLELSGLRNKVAHWLWFVTVPLKPLLVLVPPEYVPQSLVERGIAASKVAEWKDAAKPSPEEVNARMLELEPARLRRVRAHAEVFEVEELRKAANAGAQLRFAWSFLVFSRDGLKSTRELWLRMLRQSLSKAPKLASLRTPRTAGPVRGKRRASARKSVPGKP